MAALKMLKLGLQATRRWSSSATRRKASDPLRILFCGSDEFSAASLSALQLEHARNPSLIQSIDVLVRPPKPTGRGYKVLREVPLQSVARSLSLPLHAVDTFTGWTPPVPYNLVVAVSFGLFVPRRILRSATYGGLNVHPSLLPDLRGPAPLHHALLSGRTHTGVSLQTLSEEGFDSGEVLAQTPLPGIEIGQGMDVAALRDVLAAAGAEMLVGGLRAGVHVPPREDVGWVPSAEERRAITHAPKITKRDSEVRWGDWTAEVVARRARLLGDTLWSRAAARDGKTKRVILHGVEAVPPLERSAEMTKYLQGGAEERKAMKDQSLVRLVAWRHPDLAPGVGEDEARPQWAVLPYFEDGAAEGAVVVPLTGGDCLRIHEIKLEGEKSCLAAVGFRRISHTAEELRKLREDAMSGGDGEAPRNGSVGADALSLGLMGLFGSLID
jgi:methionyl-tRNA formyltransferase